MKIEAPICRLQRFNPRKRDEIERFFQKRGAVPITRCGLISAAELKDASALINGDFKKSSKELTKIGMYLTGFNPVFYTIFIQITNSLFI